MSAVADLAFARMVGIARDVITDLTDRTKGASPLAVVLIKARADAVKALEALPFADPEDRSAIRSLQNEVRRFDDLVTYVRDILARGEEAEASQRDQEEIADAILQPENDATIDQRAVIETLGLTPSRAVE